MITKGIVEEVLSQYKVKVRLPIFDGVKSNKNEVLNSATICTLPSIDNVVTVGDIVFVGFEDNDLGKPIVIGQLFSSKSNNTKSDLKLNTLYTESITKLSSSTWIGAITPKEINSLYGVRDFIQNQLDELNSRLKKLEGDNN